jgi:uncharacterized protein (DUF1330 family)
MPIYFVANSTVTDPDQLAAYLAAVPATFEGHEFKVVVASNEAETLEGDAPGERVVVLEFPSREAFRAWYDSPAYREVIGLRLGATSGFAVLADGFA